MSRWAWLVACLAIGVLMALAWLWLNPDHATWMG